MNLPNGEPAENLDEYVSVWTDLARPICNATGYELSFYDPFIGLVSESGGVIYLPVQFVELINTRLRIADCTIRNFNKHLDI